MRIYVICCAALFLATGALAQTPPAPSEGTPDLPFGAPYNVETMAAGERLDNAQVSLRDYISSRLDQIAADLNGKIEETRKLMDERTANSSQAIAKADAANEKRLDSINEFRGQLNDQAKTFMTKEAAEGRFKSLEDKIELLRDNTDKNSARIAAIETGGSPQAQQAEREVVGLDRRLTEMEARGAGLNQAWVFLTTGMGLIVGAFVVWGALRRRPPVT